MVDQLQKILEKAVARPLALDESEREKLLALTAPEERERLYAAARAVKERECGKGVALRALIECGNRCSKDCLYCGIRSSNCKVARYSQSVDEVVAEIEYAAECGFGSIVLQAGELESEKNTVFYETVLERVRRLDLGVTLSLGEQTEEVYRRWKEAGASRYLLRIESSDRKFYASLHPASHSWHRRKECLGILRKLGYQVGTGIMCGLPGQTIGSIARDIGFFAEVDADMIGSGPYLPDPDTPLSSAPLQFDDSERFVLGLNLIATTRLYLHDVNIASATALQVLDEAGREAGVAAGANVIMPNFTESASRSKYTLYPGKTALDNGAAVALETLRRRLADMGESIIESSRGDSKHFARRNR